MVTLWVDVALNETVFVIGVTGMAFIVAGWALALTSVPPLRLSLLYGIGSFLLTIYSIVQGDLIFTALNSLATLLAVINIVRALKRKLF